MMKLLCLNREECGCEETLDKLEEEGYKDLEICPWCYGPVLLVDQNYKFPDPEGIDKIISNFNKSQGEK